MKTVAEKIALSTVQKKSPVKSNPFLPNSQALSIMRDLLEKGALTAKLKVGAQNTSAEHEADRMAIAVTGNPLKTSRSLSAESFKINPSATASLKMQNSGGRSLDTTEKNYFEPRFQQTFNDVQIHEGTKAEAASSAINARAFTYGSHIFMGKNEYNRGTPGGNQLLAHELTHTIQNRTAPPSTVQRWSLSLPFVEKILIGASDAASEFVGREMTEAEIELARTIYGDRIDYSKVQIIQSNALCWRAVGNNIFTAEAESLLTTPYNRQTLIHELGHVWQYQHFGSSYISKSLFDQAVAAINTGSRDGAYTYEVTPGKRFLEYGVEQQASIIEHYFHNRWVLNENPNATAQERANAQTTLTQLEPLVKEMQSVLTRSQQDELMKETKKANK